MRFVFSLIALNLSLFVMGQTVAFTEDFQSGIPNLWSVVDNDNLTPHPDVSEYNEAWIVAEDPDSAGNFVASATSYFDPAGQADRWLITPQLNLTGYGNLLSWTAKSHDASFPDSYLVMISTTGNSPSDFTDTLTGVFGEFDLNQRRTLNLSDSGYVNQPVYVAFRLRTEDGFKLYLDDVTLVVDDPASVNELTGFDIQFSILEGNTLQFQSNTIFDKVSVYNSLGQKVGEFDENQRYKVDSKDLIFIRFESQQGTFTKKFRLN